MGVKKEVKEKIVELMLQELSTDEIAERVGYSIGTVRNVFEELRDELGVNTKTGIAVAYIRREIEKLNDHLRKILVLTKGCKITPNAKGISRTGKRSKKRKNKF